MFSCKLKEVAVFDNETKAWVTNGACELKLLEDRTNQNNRVLILQGKKVISNHLVHPEVGRCCCALPNRFHFHFAHRVLPQQTYLNTPTGDKKSRLLWVQNWLEEEAIKNPNEVCLHLQFDSDSLGWRL